MGGGSFRLAMEKSEIITRVLRRLWLAEHKADNYVLLVRSFRSLYFIAPDYRADDELAEYLLKCCSRLNEFFPSCFDIKVDSLAGLDDETCIGSHWLLDFVGTLEKVEALIQAGEFEPEKL